VYFVFIFIKEFLLKYIAICDIMRVKCVCDIVMFVECQQALVPESPEASRAQLLLTKLRNVGQTPCVVSFANTSAASSTPLEYVEFVHLCVWYTV
jgi:hypothetical protein